MQIFLDLYSSLLPYLLCIPLGYFLKRKNIIPEKVIHIPLLFVLVPLLLIEHVLETKFSNLLILSVMSFTLALLMVLPAIGVYKKYDGLDNPLLKSGFSFFNVLFFGIPVIESIFDKDAVTTLICIYVGTGFYGYTVGYTMVAKSKFGTKKSIKEAIKVPFIYALLLALGLKLLDYELPNAITPVLDVLGVAVTAGGMTILGMNINKINFKGVKIPYFSKVLGIRVISAIGIAAVLLLLEFLIIDELSRQERQIFALLSLFPIAATLTVFASLLKSEEKESALLIVFSMVISLLLVPVAALYFG